MTEPPAVFEIGGVLRRYDWGSPTLMQQLLGEQPDGRPAAELWFGAHPGDPSPALGTTLDQVLDEPLPYLLKILAAGKALSLQVHPTRARAEAGFDREDAAGVPRDARERNYVDRNHKPELLCALTPFRALCGFRPVARTVAMLDEAGIPELDFVTQLLRGPDGLRAAFTAVLDHPDPAALTAADRSLGASAAVGRAYRRRRLPRRRRCGARGAAQRVSCSNRARRSTSAPATCTATCAVWRSR